MGPRQRDYARVTRRLEAALGAPAKNPDAVIRDFLELTGELLSITSSCWHHTDPRSGFAVASSAIGDPPGSLEWSLQFEYARPDVSRFDELYRRRDPVAAISSETGGRPSASQRYREMIAPTGTADELRIAFKDGFGVWASLVAFTSRTMTPEDLKFVSGLVTIGAAALRAATARAMLEAPAAPPGRDANPAATRPSVVILDRADRMIAADAISRARLQSVPEERDVAVPGVISVLAAKARYDPEDGRATARMRTRHGDWLELDASALQDAPGSVAVVLQPAPLHSIREAVLRALGLSGRERQIALLSLQGRSAKEIAGDLGISPWTVQDHLKAVYAKTGASSRAQLRTGMGVAPAER